MMALLWWGGISDVRREGAAGRDRLPPTSRQMGGRRCGGGPTDRRSTGHLRGLSLGTPDRLRGLRIHILRDGVGALRRRTGSDRLQPALEVGISIESQAEQIVWRRPAIGGGGLGRQRDG